MKSVIVAIFIAGVIVFSGIYSTKKLEDVSVYLIDICEKTNEIIEKGNFSEAEKYIDDIEKCIEENYIMFASSIDHNEIDKIDVNIDQMKIYIKEEQKADALSYGSVLIGLFEHLPKDHRLKLENIL